MNSEVESIARPDEGIEAELAGCAFAGDTGQLSIPARRVIVTLLLGPSLDGHRQKHLWPVLVRDEAVVRSRLHELFLELVVDHDQQVAFTRQVVADDFDAPVLLRRSPLTFLQSTLLLFLRHRLTQADAQAERAVVSGEEIKEHLRVYEPAQNTDRANFDKKLDAAVDKAKDLSLLHRVKGTEDRYEVSPTLKILFAAEEIQALTRVYAAIAQPDASSDSAAPALEQTSEE